MSILGIDYGTKRVGLALAESPLDLPLPFKMILNQGEEALLVELKKIVEEEMVTEVVVGLPVTETGQSGELAQKTLSFVDQLRFTVAVPVQTFDERYSSRLADELSQGQGVPRDVGAAMIILEDYLNKVTRNHF